MRIANAIAIFLLSITIKAQVPVVLQENTPITIIGKSVALYEDKTATLTFSEISSPGFSSNFKNSDFEIPNYNITTSRIWCRLQVLNRSGINNWYLEASNGSLGNVAIYCQTGAGWKGRNSGFGYSPAKRDLFANRVMFWLNLPSDSLQTIYLCAYDKLPLQIHFSIGKLPDYIRQNHSYDFFNGAFFGLLFMLIIYNLFIYFSVRDKVFIFYVLYVASNALFISYANGYGSHLPESLTAFISSHPTMVPFMLGTFSCLFMMVFLNLKATYKTGYKISVFLISFIPLVIFLDFAGYSPFGVILVQVLGLVLTLVSLIIGIKVWKKGYKPAKFFLVGWSFYLVGLFIYIAADAQLIPFTGFTHNALEIGTAIEAILLSMAVGDKISNFKKEKELAQEEALISAKENERLVREQNIYLEQKVKERTIELQQQKELIEEKNKDILDSIRYAKRIQQSLLPQETFIKRVLKKLKRGD